MDKNPVIILGANAVGKSALDIFGQNDLLIYCFLDENDQLYGQEIFDIAIMGSPSDDGFLKYIGKKCDAFVAALDSQERKRWVELLVTRRKVQPLNAVHPRANISSYAQVGTGNLIEAGVFIGAAAQVGSYCLLQPNAVVAASATLADYVSIGANSSISERVRVGEGALIGAGAVIMPGIEIGAGAQVAPGALVMKPVEEGQTVFGSPAQVV